MAMTQAMAAAELGYVAWTESLCGNLKMQPEGPSNCDKPAAKVICIRCGLVEYCSKRCRDENRPIHDIDCKAAQYQNIWIATFAAELRMPQEVFPLGPSEHQQLWDTLPASDLAKLSQNEGNDFSGEFRVYIPNALDLRNVIETVNALPGTFNGKLKFVINSPDFHVVARHLVMLELARVLEPNLAAEIILHLWYSARLTKKMLNIINEKITLPMEELYESWSSGSTGSAEFATFSRDLVETCEISRQLSHSQILAIIRILDAKHDLSNAMSQRRAVITDPIAGDRKDVEAGLQQPTWRIPTLSYEYHGVLAPLRAHVEGIFDVVNPTLFAPETSKYLLHDLASPLHGWDINELRNHPHAFSRDDLHGQLYASLRNRLVEFAQRLQSGTRVSFHVTCQTVLETKHLAEQGPFDRIDTGQLVEKENVGLSRILHKLSPHLQPLPVNPHATLLTTFTHDWYHEHRDVEIFDASMSSNIRRLGLWGWNVHSLSPQHSRMITSLSEFACEIFEPFDAIWATFIKRTRIARLEKRTQMRLRAENQVVSMWPRRFWEKEGEEGEKGLEVMEQEQEAFDAVMGSGRGKVRVGEWVRMKEGEGDEAGDEGGGVGHGPEDGKGDGEEDAKEAKAEEKGEKGFGKGAKAVMVGGRRMVVRSKGKS